MARVAVTGSSGKLGRAVVDHLVNHGWDVIALDRTPSPRADVVSSVVDLTDYGQAVEALSGIDDRHDGVDALVHLAAIPAPGLRTNAATFTNNTMASYNTYTAALRAGITPHVLAVPDLGLDIDRPENLRAFLSLKSQTRTHAFLSAIHIVNRLEQRSHCNMHQLGGAAAGALS